jgi:signal transduction histidine kinase
MRRRLVAVILSLVAGVLLAVEVPLAVSDARSAGQTLVADRTTDTARLARLAAPALAADDVGALQPEVRAYDDLYGIRVEVYDRGGQLLLSSAPGSAARSAPDTLARALAGRRAAAPLAVLPQHAGSLSVAEPVLRGSEVAGAVVTVSPTDRLRAHVLTTWGLLAAAAGAALGLAGLVTVPVARWILRPVRRLDDAVHSLTQGDLTAHVDVGPGPPELRRLADDFNRMAEAIRTSHGQQRALVADASHQLRNPLTALRLRVEALEHHLGPAGRAEHRLAVEEAERLTRVLDDTLALARAQEDREDREGDHSRAGDPRAVDVRECARDRLRAWSEVAARDDTTMLLAGDGACWVLARPGVLEQVLDAVLDNALRFAVGGTVTVSVDVLDPVGVALCIVDDGPGLTAEQCAAATRRFWRGPDQQNVPGSGLGLAIASTLVERCGGRLALSPASPHGLQVDIRLPRLDAARSPVRSRPQPVPTPGFAER